MLGGVVRRVSARPPGDRSERPVPLGHAAIRSARVRAGLHSRDGRRVDPAQPGLGPLLSAVVLPRDLFAGIVLTAILVPAGMGYAEASGLPAIVGLYATIVPLLAYAVLGPSRILVLGPDSALLPLIAAASSRCRPATRTGRSRSAPCWR